MTLQKRFVNEHVGMRMATKDIFEWYKEHKGGLHRHAYRSTVFAVLIEPLVNKGIVTKLARGFYEIGQWPAELDYVTQAQAPKTATVSAPAVHIPQDEDEWKAALKLGPEAYIELHQERACSIDMDWQEYLEMAAMAVEGPLFDLQKILEDLD